MIRLWPTRLGRAAHRLEQHLEIHEDRSRRRRNDVVLMQVTAPQHVRDAQEAAALPVVAPDGVAIGERRVPGTLDPAIAGPVEHGQSRRRGIEAAFAQPRQ